MVSTGLAEETRLEGRLEDLYVRHAPAAGRFAYLLTADRGEAEDLVQEAFVRVVGRFGHSGSRTPSTSTSAGPS